MSDSPFRPNWSLLLCCILAVAIAGFVLGLVSGFWPALLTLGLGGVGWLLFQHYREQSGKKR